MISCCSSVGEVDEIVGIPGNADDQVAVFFGAWGVEQGAPGDDVELDVVGVLGEVSTHEVGEIPEPILVGQQLRA
jgi:hypothetical protein